MAIWTIKGDPDVTVTTIGGVTYGMDDTGRTFEELNISIASLKFQSLADDVFSYTARTLTAAGKGTIVPRDGQIITLLRNGTRVFKGHVVRPKLGLKSLAISVMGPWWWMGKIYLESAFQDKTGVSAKRSSYVMPEQNLRTSLQALVNLAEDSGVPMARIGAGVLTDRIKGGWFTMLPWTFSNMSFANALAEIMSAVPDAVAWFDYSPSTPELNIWRRGAMTQLAYTVGGTGDVRVESADIYPRIDQEVKRVELRYVTREAATGLPKWAAQADGPSAATAPKAKVQIVTISGPETVQILPKDDFEKVGVETHSSGTPDNDYVKTRAAAIDSNTKTFGAAGGIITSVSGYSGWSKDGVYTTVSFPGIGVTKRDGSAISLTGRYLLLTTDLPEWLRKELGAVDVKITGTWGSVFTQSAITDTPSATWFNWYYAAPRKGTFYVNRYSNSNDPLTKRFWAMPFECDGVLVKTQYATKTAVYKPWDYRFIAPPEDLATNLLGAQNWLPWEGPVVIARADLTAYNGLQRKINLNGSHPDHADMNALVKAITYDIPRSRVTWDLGAPARIDPGNLIAKLRRSPQDNIVWL